MHAAIVHIIHTESLPLSHTHRLSQEIAKLSEVVERQKAMISKYGIYQQFMERVLEQSVEVSNS